MIEPPAYTIMTPETEANKLICEYVLTNSRAENWVRQVQFQFGKEGKIYYMFMYMLCHYTTLDCTTKQKGQPHLKAYLRMGGMTHFQLVFSEVHSLWCLYTHKVV